jgi:tripartite-type tricarboxylate transporter receptor subunit TctC
MRVMPLLHSRRWCGVLFMLATLPVWSQAYPSKPIRMVVPFAAGGPSDVVIRVVGQKLTEAWGQTVVIDNRGGAGGNIGVGLAAKAPPDGYTLLLASMHFVVNPSLYSSAGYDAEKDFAAVTNIAISPVIMAAHPSLAARDPRELAQLAKRSTIDYGSPGTGTAGHLAGELFNMVAGTKMQHIPYKGAAPAFADLLGAQIKLAITAMPIATPHVKAGRLRAIAVTTLQRSPALPDAPTVAESGYPGFFVDNMYGVLAPRGTPTAVIASLHDAIARVVKQPEMRERLTTQGYDPLGNSPAEFAGYLRAEVGKWAKVVRDSGLRAD